jgi:hypothetical protein
MHPLLAQREGSFSQHVLSLPRASWYQSVMTKSKRAIKKSPKKGRPKSTGAGTPMVVRMHDPQLAAIDSWIGDAGLSRPEAIRQLVDWALEHAKRAAAAVSIPEDPPAMTVVRRARANELLR